MGEIFQRATPSSALPWTGERLITETGGQVEIEHLHRYFFARSLCRGLDVLDVASGEGYGAALLAQVARSVVGVEIAGDTVEHARAAYVWQPEIIGASARDHRRFAPITRETAARAQPTLRETEPALG